MAEHLETNVLQNLSRTNTSFFKQIIEDISARVDSIVENDYDIIFY